MLMHTGERGNYGRKLRGATGVLNNRAVIPVARFFELRLPAKTTIQDGLPSPCTDPVY